MQDIISSKTDSTRSAGLHKGDDGTEESAILDESIDDTCSKSGKADA
jgi:hypothetical protein